MLRQREDGRKGKLQMLGLHHSSRKTGARWGPGHRSGWQRGQTTDRGDRQNRNGNRKHAG